MVSNIHQRQGMSIMQQVKQASAEIELSGKKGAGKVMLVDPELKEVFERHGPWWVNPYGYAVTNTKTPEGKHTSLMSHHLVFRNTKYESMLMEVHHIDMDPMNNQRSNLLPIKMGTKAGKKLQATATKKSKTYKGITPSSFYRGVYWNKQTKTWRVQCTDINGKSVHIGYFKDEHAAGMVYKAKVDEIIAILTGQVIAEWESDSM